MVLQATVDANDGDFVIPTVRPLSRGSSRHSILASASHDAPHSKAPNHVDHPARSSSSRKTSFNLGQSSGGLSHPAQSQPHVVPKLGPVSPPQQQQSRRSSAGDTSAVAEPRQYPASMQQHKPGGTLNQADAANGPRLDVEALSQTIKSNQGLGRTGSPGISSRVMASKPVQKRDKAVKPIQDWVGFGSKKQPHK